jgi:beta-1,4-mannosyltransferase
MTQPRIVESLSTTAPGEVGGRIPQQRGGTAAHPVPAVRRPVWRPGFAAFPLAFLAYLAVSWWAWAGGSNVGVTGWIVAVAWALPVGNTLIGLSGALVATTRLRPSRSAPPTVPDLLVVAVPTIGRPDTFPALVRVVQSFCRYLPENFTRLRVDLIIEEGCAEANRIAGLAATSDLIRVITVPRGYRTPGGTRFKARANHYAHELRLAEGEARDDVWVLHMDDDTGVGPDTPTALARFIDAQRLAGTDARHLAQGVLSYPREHSTNRLIWLADAVRPGCDIAMFAATTGRGMPRAGLHGELLLVRASVEAEIGWDFGPHAIVEDSEFALRFCGRHPRGSDWFPGLCYGASPATLMDFVRQRERWAWGLLRLAVTRSIPLRNRLLLMYNVGLWTVGPVVQLIFFLMLAIGAGDVSMSPVTAALLPVCALNTAYAFWLYWEGMKINVWASARPRRRWWEAPSLVLLIPVFTLFEAAGAIRGLVRFLRNGAATFTVIAKPR